MTMLLPIGSAFDVDAPLAGLAGEQTPLGELYLRLACGDEVSALAGICSHES